MISWTHGCLQFSLLALTDVLTHSIIFFYSSHKSLLNLMNTIYFLYEDYLQKYINVIMSCFQNIFTFSSSVDPTCSQRVQDSFSVSENSWIQLDDPTSSPKYPRCCNIQMAVWFFSTKCQSTWQVHDPIYCKRISNACFPWLFLNNKKTKNKSAFVHNIAVLTLVFCRFHIYKKAMVFVDIKMSHLTTQSTPNKIGQHLTETWDLSQDLHQGTENNLECFPCFSL